jgi:hypothetical protein
MAKTHGQVNEDTGRVETRRVRRVREVDFPVTRVDTAWKRFKRAAVG